MGRNYYLNVYKNDKYIILKNSTIESVFSEYNIDKTFYKGEDGKQNCYLDLISSIEKSSYKSLYIEKDMDVSDILPFLEQPTNDDSLNKYLSSSVSPPSFNFLVITKDAFPVIFEKYYEQISKTFFEKKKVICDTPFENLSKKDLGDIQMFLDEKCSEWRPVVNIQERLRTLFRGSSLDYRLLSLFYFYEGIDWDNDTVVITVK